MTVFSIQFYVSGLYVTYILAEHLQFLFAYIGCNGCIVAAAAFCHLECVTPGLDSPVLLGIGIEIGELHRWDCIFSTVTRNSKVLYYLIALKTVCYSYG